MPRPILAILLAGLVAGLTWAAPINGVSAQDQAQTPPPATEGGRYTFHRMGEAFVRLESFLTQT